MDGDGTILAVVLGVIQGVLEWLPVSSEGSIALVLTVLTDGSPAAATRFALFLHAGTAVAALAFYRGEVRALVARLPSWRPGSAFAPDRADLTFFAIATVVSGVVGLACYAALAELTSALTGGAFVALIGALLIATGLVQRTADGASPDGGTIAADGDAGADDATGLALGSGERAAPDALDAVLVGLMQGLAILPGVSRSGTTVSALLLRGHGGESSLRLSFVLAIPASLGAGLLVVLDEGVPAISPTAAAIALATSAIVGYLTVGALVALVRRVAFWAVCIGFGALAVVGGLFLLL